MKQVTLPKKFERSYGEAPYVHDEIWLSNGHFAVKKELIKDSFKYCFNIEQARANIERIIPKSKSNYYWTITDRLFQKEKGAYLRVFECKDLKKETYFDEVYIKHFNLDILYGDSEFEPFLNYDESFLIMPCRR